MKYRKKPVIVEATQWFESGDHPKDLCVPIEGSHGAFKSEGKVVRYYRHPKVDGQSKCRRCCHTMHRHGWIDTLEGGHIVCPGDWIITGVKGERYPVKNDIFLETYEKVD